jgi:hypothetical protein
MAGALVVEPNLVRVDGRFAAGAVVMLNYDQPRRRMPG